MDANGNTPDLNAEELKYLVWFFGAAIVVLLGIIWATLREDIRWLKRNVTNILVSLGLKAEE